MARRSPPNPEYSHSSKRPPNSSYSRETIDAARRMAESGVTLGDIAETTGIGVRSLNDWAAKEEWDIFKDVDNKDVLSVFDEVGRLTPQGLVERFERDAGVIAAAVPALIRRLTADQIIDKADKVAKLLDISRKILGLDGGQRSAPLVSIGILSGGGKSDGGQETKQVAGHVTVDPGSEGQ